MAFPYIRDSTKASTDGTASSLTMTKPTGAENGDLLLLLMGNENATSGEGFDPLTGWTLEFNYGSGGVDCYLGLYSRIATGDALEDSPVVPFGGSDDGHGWYLSIGGVHATDPVRIIGSSTEVVSNTLTNPSITTDTNIYSLVFSAFSFDGSDSDPITETGTGWTMIDWTESPLGSDAGGASSGAFSTKGIDTASTATGDSVWNMGGGQSDGIVGTQFTVAGTDAPQAYFDGIGVKQGIGVLTGDANIVFDEVGALIGNGILTANGSIVYNNDGTLIGSGVFSSTEYLVYSGAGTSVGQGVLTGDGSVAYFYDNSSTLIGQGIFTGDGAPWEAWDCSVLMDCSVLTDCYGTLLEELITYFQGIGSLVGEGHFASLEQLISNANGTLIGTGQLAANSQLIFNESGLLIGQGVFTSFSQIIQESPGSLIGEGHLFADTQIVLNSPGAMLGHGIFIGDGEFVAGTVYYDETGTLLGIGVFAANGILVNNVSGSIIGQGQLIGSGQLIIQGSGLLQGSGILTANASLVHAGTGSLTGYGVLSGSSHIISNGIGQVIAQGVMVGDAEVYFANTNFFALNMSAF